MLMFYVPPSTHASPSPDTWHAAVDPVLSAGILWLVFGPFMFLFFWRMCGELHDWWITRGWRPKHLRRPLK